MKKKSLRVLMVEASEDDVLLIIRELKKGGYDPVYERVKTAAAMKKALKEKPWDIILCDDSLPGFKAPSAIALLKKTNTGIPLIVISGATGEETAAECMRSGAHDYFLKGKLSRLCPAIARTLKEAKAGDTSKQTEEKLPLSEAQIKSMIAASREWIWAIDTAGRHTFSNPAIGNILGYTPDEIIRHGAAHHLVHEEDIPKMRETMSQAIEQKKGWTNLALRWKHKDGTCRYLESNAAPIFDGSGLLKGFQGSHRDVTDRRNMEEKLRESEANYRQLFDNSPAGIYRVDYKNGKFLKVNDVYCEYAGCSQEEITSLSPYDILTEESKKLFLERVEKIFQGVKVPEVVEFEILNKKGKRFYIQLHVKNVYNAEGHLVAANVVTHDITELKQIENELRASESNFRHSLDDSPLGIRISTIEGETIYANRAILDIYGYDSLEELKTTSVKDRYTPESYAEWLERKTKRSQGKFGPSEYDISIVRKSGEIRHLHVFRKEIFWNGNKQSQVIYNDITLRRQAEEKIRQSEEKYRTILENIEDGYYEVDLSGNLTFFNDSLCIILGYSREELAGMNYRHCTAEEYSKKLLPVFNKIYNTGESTKGFDWQFIRKDGTKRYVEISVSLIKDSSGKPAGFRGITHDITERKKIENALRESEELYTRLVDTLPDIIVRTDLEGKILFANDNTFKMGEYRPEEVEGRNIFEFLPVEEHPKAVERITLTLTEGKKQGPIEYSLLAKDGRKIPYETITDMFLNEDGTPNGYVHVCRDIRLRKQAEQEKDQLQERLNQSQKMESVGRLAGGVAHDFNNMLGVILGHTELAMARVESGQPIHAHLREIRKAAERSADLTRQLLAFARKQTFFPRVINLNETVEGMLKMLQRLIGEDIHLSWLPEGGPLQVKMDPSQLDQILANLCVNARDAISGVGKITIESRNIIFDKTFCADHPDFNHGDYVLLAVSDNGCGMDKETRNKLFEPFFTTKDIGKGTGLGLCTVYGIVKQNNGFVNVYSEPDQGTTFKIYLPRHTGKTEQTKIEDPQEPAVRGRETVLVVEDELAILDLSKIILEKQGYHVLSAATPGEAIKLAVEHNGEIHLLITDVVMPEMNGRDLAKRILSLYPNMKRLFMSGYTADIIAHQGILDEEMFFIQKPFSRNNLLAKAREALDQK